MVVHGEAEEDGEQEYWKPRLDGLGLLETENLVADPFLEDQGPGVP